MKMISTTYCKRFKTFAHPVLVVILLTYDCCSYFSKHSSLGIADVHGMFMTYHRIKGI